MHTSFAGKIQHELRKLQTIFYGRLFNSKANADIAKSFHKLYFDAHILNKTWSDTSWFGVPVLKSPFDLWVYQEMLFKLRPDVIVETGSAAGGSAYYFASLFDLLGAGKIITIDVQNRDRPSHPRITYVTGSSTDPSLVKKVKELVPAGAKVMVILDSDHSKAHVTKELETYWDWVTMGQYLVVEDTCINGHPVAPEFGPGPMEAVSEFMQKNSHFRTDESLEKHLFSFNTRGYLKRIN